MMTQAPPPSTSAGSNATHQSTTDPDAQLVRQSRGQATMLAYRGHVPMETPSELVVGVHNGGIG